MKRLALAGALGLACACTGEEATPFPDDFAALEAVSVDAPAEGTEGANFASGEVGDQAWGHAHLRVLAPSADVWEALQRPEVGVDRRRVDNFSVLPHEDPSADVAYIVHTRVEELLTVEYELTWRHLLVQGEVEEPERVAIRWQKTWGAAIIESIAGSVGVYSEGDETRVEIVEHLVSPGTGAVDAEAFLRDFSASILAASHGDPLPEW